MMTKLLVLLRVQKGNPSKQGLKPVPLIATVPVTAMVSKKVIHQNKDWNLLSGSFQINSVLFKKVIHQNKDWNTIEELVANMGREVQKGNPSKQGLKPVGRLPPGVLERSKKVIHQNKDWNPKVSGSWDVLSTSKKVIHQNKDWNYPGHVAKAYRPKSKKVIHQNKDWENGVAAYPTQNSKKDFSWEAPHRYYLWTPKQVNLCLQ